MDPGSLSLNAVWVSATNLIHTSGCGVYKWRERCRENVCSGYMESKDTLEKTDQELTWKSCNESIIINMRDMFPGLIIEHDNPKKCEPTCVRIKNSSKCGHQYIGNCSLKTTISTTTWDFENFSAENPDISQLISELRRARSRKPTTKTISTTTTAITTVTSKPITSMTTTTTQRMTESERDYKGESKYQ